MTTQGHMKPSAGHMKPTASQARENSQSNVPEHTVLSTILTNLILEEEQLCRDPLLNQ